MNNNTSKDVLVPGNLIGFRCEQCGECCSATWRIDIDRITYDKLIDSPDLPDFSQKTLRLPEPSDRMYAYMCLDDDGKCAYLDENKLCMIHKKKGIECLPDICRIYPRSIIVSDRAVEISSYFTCKAAVKRLDDKEPIEFYVNPVGYQCYSSNYINSIESKYNVIIPNYFIIEELLIDIMQCRDYSISERLFLAGSFIDAAGKCGDNRVPGVAESFRGLLGSSIKDIFMSVKPQKSDIINVFSDMAKAAVNMEYCPGEFNKFYSSLIENEDVIDREFFKNYKYDYILENFFVLYIFRKYFASRKLADEFCFMAAVYVFILLHMNLKSNKSKEALFEAICLCEKLLDHNTALKKVFLESRDEAKLITDGLKICCFYV